MTQSDKEPPSQTDGSRSVSFPLAISIVLLPGIFVWFLLRKGHSKTARVVAFGWTAALFLITPVLISAIGSLPDAPAPPPETLAAPDAANDEATDQSGAEEGAPSLAASAGNASTPASSARTAMSEEERKGFHCLNNWDGSYWKMQDAIKLALRDPDSFEHVETAIMPVDAKGQHTIIMSYSARNGFGGMNVQQAVGVIENRSCELIKLQM